MRAMGKGKESDPTDASANTSANASTDTPPTHYRRVGRHTTDASVDTLPTRRPTHYQHVGRHTTNTSADTLPTRRPTHYSFTIVTSFSWKQEQRHQKGRKHES